MRRRVAWVLVGVVAAASMATALSTDDPPATDDERAYELKASTLCPVCDGQNVLESNAPVATAIRRQIDDLVDEGRSDDEIRRFIALQYGQDTDARPPRSGFASLVWVLPVLAVAVGGTWLALSFRQWRAGRDVEVTDEDRALVARLRDRS
jgi:cytochrome c-type biogenesis protein CcmH